MAQHRTLFGRPLGITLIVIQKLVWAIVLVVLSATLLWFHTRNETQPLQSLFAGELSEDPHDILARTLIHVVPHLSLRSELVLGTGAVLYAALEVVEACGLWQRVLWVELLTIFETAAFLPYELWDFFQKPSVLKAVSFVINGLIVWYLVARYLRRRAEHVADRGDALSSGGEAPALERAGTVPMARNRRDGSGG